MAKLDKKSEVIEVKAEEKPVLIEPVKTAKVYTINHPTVKSDASGSVYLNGEEVKFELKNGQLKTENFELVQALQAEGWINL